MLGKPLKLEDIEIVKVPCLRAVVDKIIYESGLGNKQPLNMLIVPDEAMLLALDPMAGRRNLDDIGADGIYNGCYIFREDSSDSIDDTLTAIAIAGYKVNARRIAWAN